MATILPFASLTRLSFANTSFKDSDVAFLRFIPDLQEINLSKTSITSEAVFYLVPHKTSLKMLNIAQNEKVDDTALRAFKFLSNLEKLFLRGTKIDRNGLLDIISNRSPSTFRLGSIPESCIEYLSTRGKKYCVDIPKEYLSNPSSVRMASYESLKKNLEIHRKVNPAIPTGGSKIALEGRLSEILRMRADDERMTRFLRVGNSD